MQQLLLSYLHLIVSHLVLRTYHGDLSAPSPSPLASTSSILTLSTILHILRHGVSKKRLFILNNHVFYSHGPHFSLNTPILRRNQILITIGSSQSSPLNVLVHPFNCRVGRAFQAGLNALSFLINSSRCYQAENKCHVNSEFTVAGCCCPLVSNIFCNVFTGFLFTVFPCELLLNFPVRLSALKLFIHKKPKENNCLLL